MNSLLAFTSSGPDHRSQALFFGPGPQLGKLQDRAVLDFPAYLLEYPGTTRCPWLFGSG